jgi:arylsulfatase A-like enzyme
LTTSITADLVGPSRILPAASLGRSDLPPSVLAIAAWFGLLTGLVELAILAIRHALETSTVLGTLQMNRHFTWMVPVAHLGIFLAAGLPLAVAGRFLRDKSTRFASWLLTALGLASLLLMVQGLHPAAAAVLSLGLGRLISRRIAGRARRFAQFVGWTLPPMLVAVAALGALAYYHVALEEGRVVAALPAARPGAPNVLLVVLDTVAADHIGLHGYRRDTMPNLARLARRGVVFDQARAAAPWTLPSHASLFTGRWVHELGKVQGGKPLDATYPTLAEFLARHGYAAAGFVGNTYYCNSWYGLARGFAHYEDYLECNVLVSPAEALRCTALGRSLIRLFGTAYNVRPEIATFMKDADRVNRDFLLWLSARPDRPFFAFLNYVDAHDPYVPPPGFDRHFGLEPETVDDLETIRNWHQSHPNASERDKALAADAYDDCLAALDDRLGLLFDELDRRGVLGETLVVITSDHGEQFGEHGEYGHGRSLYRQEVRVPLIVVGPSSVPAGLTVAAPVSLRDVAATVAERIGLASDSPFPGRSLARFWEPGVPGTPGDVVLSEVNSQANPSRTRHPRLASLTAEGKVYIRDSDGREELYDLASDPDEARDLAGTHDARVVQGRCRAALDALIGPPHSPP